MLPTSSDAVAVEGFVTTDQRDVLDLTLRDQKAVEGIAMMEGEPRYDIKMPGCDLQNIDSVGRWRVDRQIEECAIKLQLADAELDGAPLCHLAGNGSTAACTEFPQAAPFVKRSPTGGPSGPSGRGPSTALGMTEVFEALQFLLNTSGLTYH